MPTLKVACFLKVKIVPLLHFFLKNGSVNVLYFGMNLPKDSTNQLPKAGFACIALKVIFQGRKGINLPLFSNVDTYCPFIL